MIIVLTTVSDMDEGMRLADLLVRSMSAACVQILPQMTSVYMWKGELQKDTEHLLLIKTLESEWEEIERIISSEHTYETPEIVRIDAAQVSAGYLEWLTSIVGE